MATPRRRWSFSLRTLFVLVTLAAAALGWLSSQVWLPWRAVDELRETGSGSFEVGDGSQLIDKWYARLLIPPRPTVIHLHGSEFTDEALGRYVSRFRTVKWLILESTRCTPQGVLRLAPHTPDLEMILLGRDLINATNAAEPLRIPLRGELRQVGLRDFIQILSIDTIEVSIDDSVSHDPAIQDAMIDADFDGIKLAQAFDQILLPQGLDWALTGDGTIVISTAPRLAARRQFMEQLQSGFPKLDVFDPNHTIIDWPLEGAGVRQYGYFQSSIQDGREVNAYPQRTVRLFAPGNTQEILLSRPPDRPSATH